MLTNAGLAIIIENISGVESNAQQVETELRARQNAYFTFILWATFGLSAVRFLGVRACVNLTRTTEFDANTVIVQCLWYFFKRNLFRLCRRK